MSEVHTAAILPFPARRPSSTVALVPGRMAPGQNELGQNKLDQNELGQRGQFCGIRYVARQLRLEAVDLRTVVTHVRAHVERSGFPQPVTSRLRHGLPIAGADAVSPKSEWLRAHVDAWVTARHSCGLTPGTVAAVAAGRAAQVDQLLAARLAPQDPAA